MRSYASIMLKVEGLLLAGFLLVVVLVGLASRFLGDGPFAVLVLMPLQLLLVLLMMAAVLLPIVAIPTYFIRVRPLQRLQPGDELVSKAGIIGRVTDIGTGAMFVTIQISDGMQVKLMKTDIRFIRHVRPAL
jgi:preprotein translocase subunit YajC